MYSFCIYLPRRLRDEGNVLLMADLDKIVKEESKTNSKLDQVLYSEDN